jgi:predicted nucleotidyltransferase
MTMNLTGKQDKQLRKLAKQLKLKLVVLYGSKISGTSRSDSDFDVAVLSAKKPDYRLFNQLFADRIFKGENVDIRFLNQADPLYAMEVVKDGILLFGDQDEFDDLKVLVNKKYIDDGRKYFPFRDQLLKEQQNYLSKAKI